MHAGRAVLGLVGPASDATIAVGEALDTAQAIREVLVASGRTFALSEEVFGAAGLAPPAVGVEKTALKGAPTVAYLSDTAPVASDDPMLPQPAAWRSQLNRLTASVKDVMRS